MALRIRYNSPVILTFSICCAAIFFLNEYIFHTLISRYFVVGGSWSWSSPMDYFSLVSYTLGHASSAHLLSNLSLILLVGPIMEEKYGSKGLLTMMLITALVTGVFQLIFFNSGLLGASGVVFMLIVLVSFTDVKKGEIPLSFILIALLYMGQEVISSLEQDNISQYAHIMGGILGGVFGFFARSKTEITPHKSSSVNIKV